MKKVKKTVALFLAFAVIAISALASGSRVLTVFNKPNAAEAPQNLDIKLFWSNSYSDNSWIMAENTAAGVPFGGNTRWEPGYTEIRYFKVRNNGSVPFDYELKIDNPENSDLEYTGILAEAIDVFVSSDAANFSSLISEANKIGTLADCFDSAAFYATVPEYDADNLGAGDEKIFAVGFKMRIDAGNEYQGYVDANGIKQNKIKFTIAAGAFIPETEPEPSYDGLFGYVWENHDEMLYRVGNKNNIDVSSLFMKGQSKEDIDPSKVSFEWENAQDYFTVAVTHTPAANPKSEPEVWMQASLQFSGEGVGTLWLKYNGVRTLGLDLEVLTANNVTKSSELGASLSNAVLLKSVETTGKFSVSGGYTLYGNGFTVTDGRADTSNTTAFCTLSDGTLDNVHIKGQEYPSLVTAGTENQYYSACTKIGGKKNYIYNSHISGCREAILMQADTYMYNSLVSGGTMSNITVASGRLTMTDCITSPSLTDGALNGLAVMLSNVSSHITLNGTFRQYNWATENDIPSDYRSMVSSFYSDSTYAYSTGGKKYVNVGILCMSTGTNIDINTAKTIISDNTGNDYEYKDKSVLGYTGTCYLPKASTGSADTLRLASYELPGQSPTLPKRDFNIENETTNPNYKEMTDTNSSFCVYDKSTNSVKISYNGTSGYEWDPMILDASKYGKQFDYTVSMNGVDYTGRKITFSQPGNYTVEYRFTDSEYYSENNADLQQGSIDYTETVNITVVSPDFPTFAFGSNGAKTQIINNEVYVMPNVSATSSSIGSTTVNGVTVYCPIVTVGPTGSNGNTSYSSGQGTYFAPAFSAVSIKDGQYTYNNTSTTWPHGKSTSNGPDEAVFGFLHPNPNNINETPYARSTNAKYYEFNKNNNGLCYTVFEIEADNAASTHIVHYYYVSNNGFTFNYFIQYNFTAMTYSATCFASGTMMTLADGSRKPIENITYGDKLLVWNFFTGKYDEENVSIIVDHGKEIYDVVNSVYSDGTVLRTIGEHGVFDYDLNEFVYLTKENCRDYIGHRFVKQGSGGYDIVTMTDAFVTVENTGAYSITSAVASNAFAEGMLTVAPPGDFYNWIDMGDKLMYDTEAFKADVDKYGLYGYDVFSDYVTYEQFAAFNGPYLKIAVEKGKFSFDYIIELIKTYL